MDKTTTQIEKTLNSLKGIKRAEANPFLYTRIESRLQQNDSSIINRNWALASIYTCLLLFCLNTYSIISYTSTSSNEITETEYAEAFLSEYGLSYPLNFEE